MRVSEYAVYASNKDPSPHNITYLVNKLPKRVRLSDSSTVYKE